jgi:hypothetical protein
MQDESKQDEQDEGGYPDGCVNPRTEALVVQQVYDQPNGYLRAQLDADLDDLDPEWVEESIASLQEAGVVLVKRTLIHPSAALRRIGALEMICI